VGEEISPKPAAVKQYRMMKNDEVALATKAAFDNK